MKQNRVCCLYRVSTDKQVDYDNNHEADIPMQRKACHKFANKMGWSIVHEEQEDGVSGHKVRAENRDKIQIIKELARKKKFDILLSLCLTESDVLQMKHRSLLNGLSKTVFRYGVHKKVNNASIIILISCSTISAFGRLTAKVRKPPFEPKQVWDKWWKKGISRAVLHRMDMILLKADDLIKESTNCAI